MPDLSLARRVLETESAAVLALVDRLDDRFERAVTLIRDCKGRVVLTGIGKSGIVCRKIAATLSSTGTAAFFLHPGDALHGDLGVVRGDDVVIVLSYGGATDELVQIGGPIKRLGAALIAITGAPRSLLAQASDVVLDCTVSKEACDWNLVPTASTTAMLALGDALAMTVLVEKGFKLDDFAILHPGGKLGKRLMRVEQLMHQGDQVPLVQLPTVMREVIYEMSRKGLGMTCVVDEDRALLGIITDGDLRRKMMSSPHVSDLTAADVMTAKPVTISRTTLAAEALHLLEERKITSIVVIDGQRRVEGVVHIHDLWDTQLV